MTTWAAQSHQAGRVFETPALDILVGDCIIVIAFVSKQLTEFDYITKYNC